MGRGVATAVTVPYSFDPPAREQVPAGDVSRLGMRKAEVDRGVEDPPAGGTRPATAGEPPPPHAAVGSAIPATPGGQDTRPPRPAAGAPFIPPS
jgi:hypothetical protein